MVWRCPSASACRVSAFRHQCKVVALCAAFTSFLYRKPLLRHAEVRFDREASSSIAVRSRILMLRFQFRVDLPHVLLPHVLAV